MMAQKTSPQGVLTSSQQITMQFLNRNPWRAKRSHSHPTSRATKAHIQTNINHTTGILEAKTSQRKQRSPDTRTPNPNQPKQKSQNQGANQNCQKLNLNPHDLP